jgi:hypothetical protein
MMQSMESEENAVNENSEERPKSDLWQQTLQVSVAFGYFLDTKWLFDAFGYFWIGNVCFVDFWQMGIWL